MKRIVDIPKEMYDWIDNGFPTEDDYVMLWEEIRQGTSLEEELEKIKQEITTNRDEWIKGQDAEWSTYDKCISIIDKYKKGKDK